MRYAAPLTMPAALGEWLGAELEARGVAAAPHYARAVLSILLHSDFEPDCEADSEAACVAALELQIQLEQQKEKEKRGRSHIKLVNKAKARPKMKALFPVTKEGVALRRRPRSWNGDKDGLKKSAAVECLLSASDNEEWPVEKFVDELVTRLKILQLEGMDRFRGVMGSSAPNFELRRELDSGSLTSVSTPGEPDMDLTAFPPLTVEEFVEEQELQTARVPFLRMPGTRLSPSVGSSSEQSLETLLMLDNCCSSGVGSYIGEEDSLTENCESFAKGRLYERGVANDSIDEASDCVWNSWADWSVSARENIWAPDQEDWIMLGKREPEDGAVLVDVDVVLDPLLQQSLAILKHDPYGSSFARVTPSSLQQQQQTEVAACGSKIFEWMGALEQTKEAEGDDDDDEELENLLISPKTHFCPIQEETDTEVCIQDGTTFEIDAEPDQVHYLRSPEGALYLPEIQENGFGWVGWIKYMVYKPPTPTLFDEDVFGDGKLSSAFPLKFRVVQNDKGCQTDFDLEDDGIEEAKSAEFYRYGILSGGELWKFNAEVLDTRKPRESSVERDGEEEEDEDGNFLKEVWDVAMDSFAKDEEKEAEVFKEESEVEEEFVDVVNDSMAVNDCSAAAEVGDDSILDEIWNPLLSNDDICEWLAQPQDDLEFYPEVPDALEWFASRDAAWPNPHIPVEYVDDEFFEEIIGSVESRGSSLSGGDEKSGAKRKSRRRRRSGRKQSHGVPAPPPQQQHRRRPCSFFVEGQCLQADCKYSHDLGSIPCRFWIESTCFKGVACPFMHAKPTEPKSYSRNRSRSTASDSSEVSRSDYKPHPSRSASRRQSRKNSTSSKTFELDLDSDFPALGEGAQEPKTKSQPIPIMSNRKIAALNVSGASLDAPGSAAVKRKRKKQTGHQNLRSEASAASLSNSSASTSNVFSLESAVSGGRLRFLSSYKEG